MRSRASNLVSEPVFCHLERTGGQSLVDYREVKGSGSLRGLSKGFVNGHWGLEDVGTVSGMGMTPATSSS